MDDNTENKHIILPKYEGEYKKQKRPGFGSKAIPRENKKEYMETQIFNLSRAQEHNEKTKRKFSKYFDPNFIFKIKLEYEVIDKNEIKKRISIDNSIIQFLESRGLKIISPSPEGNGYWVSIADDEELKELKESLEKYAHGICKYQPFDKIKEMFIPIPPEDKIGPRLKDNPLNEDEEAYLDVEIWRMDKGRLDKFLWGDNDKVGFNRYISDKGGRVTDTFITENLCLLRVKINKKLFEEIIELREICIIDRPPKPSIHYEMITIQTDNIHIGEEPSENATGIAILDSGIITSHPLLKNAIGDAIHVPLKSNNKIKNPNDDVGHGTKVAGIALYGDIAECIEKKKFQPEVWIFSVKIMYRNQKGDAEFNHEELLEHQLSRAIRYFVENYPNCKIMNLSIGVNDQNMFNDLRQFPLATLIDELAKELNVIFVVSAGNIEYIPYKGLISQLTKDYPNYLLDDIKDVKIINPASSAYAITVGALSPHVGNSNSHKDKILTPIIYKDYPSMITRVGPGYNGMIKPELVEEGGTPLFHNRGYFPMVVYLLWITEQVFLIQRCPLLS